MVSCPDCAMADTPSTKRKFPSEWFQEKLEATQDVEMPDNAKKDLASDLSKFPAHQLGDSDLNDLAGLLPAEIHERKVVALHLKHHIRKELHLAPDLRQSMTSCFRFFCFTHKLPR